MKIGVVSDTHSLGIPKQLVDDFKSVDLIIHAGDFSSVRDLKFFTALGNCKAVYGNTDEAELQKRLPRRDILQLEKVSVGVFHGEGSPRNIVETVKQEFSKDKIQVIIFGHSHQPLNEKINGILLFNPGSPNDMVRAPYRSYGILEIKDGQAVGKIITVE